MQHHLPVVTEETDKSENHLDAVVGSTPVLRDGGRCPFHSQEFVADASAVHQQPFFKPWETITGRFSTYLHQHMLFSPEDVDRGDPAVIPPADLAVLRDILNWTREFIMRSNPGMKRPGAVCPFVRPAVKFDSLFLAVVHCVDPESPQEIYARIMSYAALMHQIKFEDADRHRLFTLMITLPDIPAALHHELLAPLHQELKTELLSQGLMIGQFYPDCPVPATTNPYFFPLQSPSPMFVIRRLIETDWRFIEGQSDWENLYTQWFGVSPALVDEN